MPNDSTANQLRDIPYGPSPDERRASLLLFVGLLVVAAAWQVFWAVSSERLAYGLLCLGLQSIGAQVAAAWHLNWKPLVAQIKPARELFDSPALLVGSGLAIYVLAAIGALLH